jgi:thymidylate kinase
VEFATERFPGFPKSVEDARAGHAFFLNLEQKRKQKIQEEDKVVILDRSIFSILAYHFAVEKMSGGRTHCFREGIAAVQSEDWLLPQVCLYLGVDDEEIALRHRGETGFYQSILLESEFNAFLREFYEKAMSFHFPSLEIVRIDARQPKQAIMAQAKELLLKMAG